ncbi:mannosyl-oligosaccharide 1,2-alpha-mannosidase IA-like isoform X2 [Convolutriloba macropyga]|uniref:mannosyl-oligosaccharide 1,2-alpha-mannosidase IA-like isoform X2 n=1 Tax=Convolutriloba macropyga TaxID=536237 RepID=UPI003F51BC94
MKIVSFKTKPLLLFGLTCFFAGILFWAYGPSLISLLRGASNGKREVETASDNSSSKSGTQKASEKSNLGKDEKAAVVPPKHVEPIQHNALDQQQKEAWKHEEDLLKDVQNILKKEPHDVKKEIAEEKQKHIEVQKKVEEEAKQKENVAKLQVVLEPVNPTGGQGGIPTDPEMKSRQDFVRNMMRHAWQGYKSYGWGANEVRPVSKRGHSAGIFGSGNSGATIIDAIDTLHIMGLTDQYTEARNWIAVNFNFNPSGDISVFETNIRFIGGLLSIYALTGDKMFREKAEEVARKLMPAFNTNTGIPKSLLNLKTMNTKNYPWAAGGSSILSEFGTLQLEMDYLSHVSGDPLFKDKVQKINRHLRSIKTDSNLYSNYLNPATGKWGSAHYSVGALGDSFYEYLVKGWLLHSKIDSEQRVMYDSATAAIKEKMVQKKGDFTYVAEMRGNKLVHKMDHLACFVGGMFALGGYYGIHVGRGMEEGASESERNREFLDLGAQVTATCHESYTKTATKIGPDSFHFEGTNVATPTKGNEKQYLLRPEVVESYFVLWRTTKDTKYREWGWEAAQAIERHCRKEAGYSGLRDVTNANTAADDVQQSFFLAETLKYLYLLFSDDTLIPLDHWVFNTEAHPIPILPS